MDARFPDQGRFRPLRPSTAWQVFPGPAEVRACWETLRKPGSVPDRAELHARCLAGVLDRVFLAEPLGKGIAHLRFAGSTLASIAGTDLRGLPLCCLFASEARETLAEVVECVAADRRLSTLVLTLDRCCVQPIAQLLLLPLTDGPEKRLVLGCLGSNLVPPRSRFRILRLIEEQPVVPRTLASEKIGDGATPSRRHLKLVHCSDD